MSQSHDRLLLVERKGVKNMSQLLRQRNCIIICMKYLSMVYSYTFLHATNYPLLHYVSDKYQIDKSQSFVVIIINLISQKYHLDIMTTIAGKSVINILHTFYSARVPLMLLFVCGEHSKPITEKMNEDHPRQRKDYLIILIIIWATRSIDQFVYVEVAKRRTFCFGGTCHSEKWQAICLPSRPNFKLIRKHSINSSILPFSLLLVHPINFIS